MKYIAAVIVLLALIGAGVFLVLNMDVSSDYVAYQQAVEGRHSESLRSEAADSHSEGIAEDPEVGILLLPYEYAEPVPEGEAVDASYFDRAVFIGDSRMLGLIRYNDIDPINYCSVGFSVGSYDTNTFVRVGDESLSVKQALEKNDDYDSVYISTGLNELGWSIGRFAEKYREMIKDIKSKAGERPVYIQLIMPVTRGFESSKVMNLYGLKNSDVSAFNDVIIEIAREYKVYYFDCAEIFVLDNGSLDPKKSSDGAHLTLDAYKEQLEYYKTHVVRREMYA